MRETARDNLADKLNSRADIGLTTLDEVWQRKNGDPGNTAHTGRVATVIAILRWQLRTFFLWVCDSTSGAHYCECGCEGILLQRWSHA